MKTNKQKGDDVMSETEHPDEPFGVIDPVDDLSV